jgi:hypothetical protein
MTDGRGSLRSSVTSVWGPKSLEGVLDIDIMLDVEIDAVMARREGLTTGYIPLHSHSRVFLTIDLRTSESAVSYHQAHGAKADLPLTANSTT